MKISDLLNEIQQVIPFYRAEFFDNVGLLFGRLEKEVSSVMICHDVTYKSIKESVKRNANVIICFHPIWFNDKKNLHSSKYPDDIIISCIENGISVIAIHTAWDKHPKGLNYLMAQYLGLQNIKPLIPNQKDLVQLNVYAPRERAQEVRNVLADAGAGALGDYENCSFSQSGDGRFKPIGDANPKYGILNQVHTIKEEKITVTIPKSIAKNALNKVRDIGFYEEVAHEILPLLNENQHEGLGSIGSFESPMNAIEFLDFIKEKLEIKYLRHSKQMNTMIETVAILGGSGGSALGQAISLGVDAYITGDLKYHDFLTAQEKLLLVDAGHLETERFAVEGIYQCLKENLPNFVFLKSETEISPVFYY